MSWWLLGFGGSPPLLRYSGHVLIPEVDADRLREVCERYGVASLEVFGSVARNEDRQDSDVDLLYVLKPEARLGFRLFDLEDDLAALFGRPVDLIARKAINKYIREQVLADAQPLYAA
jgi:predicted nucleotidyltransferase